MAKVFYMVPSKDGHWYVSRQDEAMRIFPTKQMAQDYAATMAIKYRPSSVIELTKDGNEVAREEYG